MDVPECLVMLMKGLWIVESRKHAIKLVEGDPELLSKYNETSADGFSSGDGVKYVSTLVEIKNQSGVSVWVYWVISCHY